MKNINNAISYLRFSSKKQGKLGKDSYRRQFEATEKYCKQNNLVLNSRLEDLGVSAFSGKNLDDESALGGFLKLVHTGEIPKGTVLICENLDRLTRGKILDAVSLFTSILKAGINIVTTMDGKRYSYESVSSNPMELMISITYLTRGNNESQVKSDRVKESWKTKLSNINDGKNVKHAHPLWLKFEDGKYVKDEEKAKVVKLIFELYVSGRGVLTVTQELEKRGIKPFGRSKHWIPQTVSRMLFGKSAIGYNDFVEPPIKGYYPAIVSEELFYRAQSQLQQNTTKRGRNGDNEINIFGGLCKCHECGGSMVKYYIGNKDGKYSYLRCLNAKLKKTKCGMVNFPKFEDSFLAVFHSGMFKKLLQTENVVIDRTEEITGKLIDLTKTIDRITDSIIKTESPTLEAKLKQLEVEKRKVEQDLENERAKVASVSNPITDYSQLIENLNKNLKSEEYRLKMRKFMRSIIREIITDKNGYRVNFVGGDYVIVKFEKDCFEYRQSGEERTMLDYDSYKTK